MPDAAVTSDFIVGFCGETDEDFQMTFDLVARMPLQEQLHLQVQRAARHQGRRTVSRRRAGRSEATGATTNCWRCKTRSAKKTTSHSSASAWKCSSKAPANGPNEHGEDQGDLVQLTGRTHCDRIVVFMAHSRLTGEMMPVVVYEVSSHTLFGAVPTEQAGPTMQLA